MSAIVFPAASLSFVELRELDQDEAHPFVALHDVASQCPHLSALYAAAGRAGACAFASRIEFRDLFGRLHGSATTRSPAVVAGIIDKKLEDLLGAHALFDPPPDALVAAATAQLASHPVVAPAWYQALHVVSGPKVCGHYISVLCVLVAAGVALGTHGDVAFRPIDDLVTVLIAAAGTRHPPPPVVPAPPSGPPPFGAGDALGPAAAIEVSLDFAEALPDALCQGRIPQHVLEAVFARGATCVDPQVLDACVSQRRLTLEGMRKIASQLHLELGACRGINDVVARIDDAVAASGAVPVSAREFALSYTAGPVLEAAWMSAAADAFSVSVQWIAGGKTGSEALRFRDLRASDGSFRPLAELCAAMGPTITLAQRRTTLPTVARLLRESARRAGDAIDDYDDSASIAALVAEWWVGSAPARVLTDVAADIANRKAALLFRRSTPAEQFVSRFSRVISQLPSIKAVVGAGPNCYSLAAALKDLLKFPSALDNLDSARILDRQVKRLSASLGFCDVPTDDEVSQERIARLVAAFQQTERHHNAVPAQTAEGNGDLARSCTDAQAQADLVSSPEYRHLANFLDNTADTTGAAQKIISFALSDCDLVVGLQLGFAKVRLAQDPRGVAQAIHRASSEGLVHSLAQAMASGTFSLSSTVTPVSHEFVTALRGKAAVSKMSSLNWYDHIIARIDGPGARAPRTISNMDLVVTNELATTLSLRVENLAMFCGFTVLDGNSIRNVFASSEEFLNGPYKVKPAVVANFRHGAMMAFFHHLAFLVHGMKPDARRPRRMFREADVDLIWAEFEETKQGVIAHARSKTIMAKLADPHHEQRGDRRKKKRAAPDTADEDEGDDADSSDDDDQAGTPGSEEKGYNRKKLLKRRLQLQGKSDYRSVEGSLARRRKLFGRGRAPS